MTLIRILLVLAVIVVLPGCSRNAPDAPRGRQADSAADTSASVGQKRATGTVRLAAILAAADRPPGVDTLAVLDRLPAPRRVTEVVRENRHLRGAQDTLRTLHYERLEFTVVHAANGHELLQRVEATGASYATDEGLHPGMARAEARQLLGSPTRVEGDVAVYEDGGPTPDVLRVAYRRDRVARLTWSFYVD